MLDPETIKTIQQEAEQGAETCFKELGFAVAKVQTSNQKTADYRIDGDGPGYILEVKSRFMSEEPGPPKPTNQFWDSTVFGWLSDASKQCRTLDREHERLWLVWGTAEGPLGEESQFRRIINALYGVQAFRDKSGETFFAYYGKASVFERHLAIDAAILVHDEGMAFCPNEFSPRLDALKNSRVTKQLEAVANLRPHFPTDRLEKRECVIPRTEAAVLRHVQKVFQRPELSPSTELHMATLISITLTDEPQED